jgi:hypothetical protein
MVKKLLQVLHGDEFTRRLERLGGYKLNHPGEVKSWN